MIKTQIEINGYTFRLEKVADHGLVYNSELKNNKRYELYISLFRPKKEFSIGYINFREIHCTNKYNFNSKVKNKVDFLELKDDEDVINFLKEVVA